MGFLPWGGKGGEPPLAEASNTSKKQQKAAPPKPTNRWQERMDQAREIARERKQARRKQAMDGLFQGFRELKWLKLPKRTLKTTPADDFASKPAFSPNLPPIIRPPLPPPPAEGSLGHVAVIGGGVGGLSTAFRLRQAGINVTVFEASGDPGGLMRSFLEDGFFWEAGPGSIKETDEVASLVADLGLRDEVCEVRGQSGRGWVMKGGRLVQQPCPHRPHEFLFTRVLSPAAKLRILAEPLSWMRRDAGRLAQPLKHRRRVARPAQQPDDESAAAFLTRHFGAETTQYLYGPALVHQYGAALEDLSTKHCLREMWKMERRHGSLVLGAAMQHVTRVLQWPARALRSPRQLALFCPRQRLPHQHRQTPTKLQTVEQPQQGVRGRSGAITFLRGSQTLTDALAARVGASAFAFNAAATSLVHMADADGVRWWMVNAKASDDAKGTLESKHMLGRMKFDAVVLALPAHALRHLKITVDGQRLPQEHLPVVEYSPLAVLQLGFLQRDVATALDAKLGDGTPQLRPAAPTDSKDRAPAPLALSFVSRQTPYRAPRGCEMVTATLGGLVDPHVVRRSRAEVVSIVARELREHHGITGRPLLTRHVLWRRACPVFTPGYDGVLAEFAALQAAAPGLHMVGAHVAGPMIDRVVAHAGGVAEAVVDRLVERASQALFAKQAAAPAAAEAARRSARAERKAAEAKAKEAARQQELSQVRELYPALAGGQSQQAAEKAPLFMSEPAPANAPAPPAIVATPEGTAQRPQPPTRGPAVKAADAKAKLPPPTTPTPSIPAAAPAAAAAPPGPRRPMTREEVRARDRKEREDVIQQLKEEKAIAARNREKAEAERRLDRERLAGSGIKQTGERPAKAPPNLRKRMGGRGDDGAEAEPPAPPLELPASAARAVLASDTESETENTWFNAAATAVGGGAAAAAKDKGGGRRRRHMKRSGSQEDFGGRATGPAWG